MAIKPEWSESEFRQTLQSTLAAVEKVFDEVDPDVVEASLQFGALTLQLANGARCILSGQPAVRQLWVAVAARGIAHHFNWDFERRQWWDDKGKGIELFQFLENYLRDDASLDLHFGA